MDGGESKKNDLGKISRRGFLITIAGLGAAYTAKKLVPGLIDYKDEPLTKKAPSSNKDKTPNEYRITDPIQTKPAENIENVTNSSEPEIITEESKKAEITWPRLESKLLTRIVDKENPISEEEIQSEIEPLLITINELDSSIPVINEKIKINSLCFKNLKDLIKDSQTDGVKITIRSGFRSYPEQKIALDKVSGDISLVAEPGTTQHHTGLAIDFTTPEIGNIVGIYAGFESTLAGTWLAENASKYGFVTPFTNRHDNLQNEVWHYLYVGNSLSETYQNLKTKGWTGDVFDILKAVNSNDRTLLLTYGVTSKISP